MFKEIIGGYSENRKKYTYTCILRVKWRFILISKDVAYIYLGVLQFLVSKRKVNKYVTLYYIGGDFPLRGREKEDKLEEK
jgi:uncharacterized membrane protein